jgi:hypothetical protein
MAPPGDDGETIGQLCERVPASGDWLVLPEYGVRVRRWSAAGGGAWEAATLTEPCHNEASHAAHEWYGEPAALRRQCPGRPGSQA